MNYFILEITFKDGTTGTTSGYSTDMPTQETAKTLAESDIVSHGKVVEAAEIKPISIEEYKKIRGENLPPFL